MVKFLAQHIKWFIVAVGVLCFSLTQTEWWQTIQLCQHAEGLLVDHRYRRRGSQPPHPDIKLVGLASSSFKLDALAPEEIAASETLQWMKAPWPWDRRVYAAVLEKLMAAGAKVVVFDFVFASQNEGDAVFAQALEKYKDRVVIGEMYAEEKDATQFKGKKLTTPNDRLLLPGTESIVGLVNMWPDGDEVVRRVKYRTSLEHETPELSGRQDNFPDNLEHLTTLAVKKFTGKTAVPSNHELFYINFQGRAGTYRPLPVENLFVEKLWAAPPFNGGTTFSNKIVVVGPTAEIYHDLHATPFGVMPGPEIQAQIMAALLQDTWLAETSPTANLALAFAMMALALAICLGIHNALVKVLLLVLTTVVFVAGCQYLFVRDDLLVSMLPPLFCLVATGTYGIIFQYALEQFERRRTRNLLERYVSKNVAKTILRDNRSFEETFKGRRQAVTILFSDIRGFTSMTENTDAHKLVAQLNEYFSEMVEIVQKDGGTLQKFIGDAIMAAWGDTHSDGIATDARRGVQAALQMRPALAKLNAGWKNNPDRTKFSIGIGVNHGEVIVGNIGTQARTEFTVLGDGVNLAARLESATKQFHTDILIGASVEALTRDQFVYRRVDLLAVKGKSRPVEVFALLSDRTQPAPAWLAQYHEAIQLYRVRDFAVASRMFEAVAGEIGEEDFLCAMYAGRCAAYQAAPPPADWNGAFTLTEK